MNRIEEIKCRWAPSPTTKADQSYEMACGDINELIAEVERLRRIEDAAISWERSPCREDTAKRGMRLLKVLDENPRPSDEEAV
ncbi:MAG: hypothetical protein ACR2QH_15230 [Geminicoccaceae bacterium]